MSVAEIGALWVMGVVRVVGRQPWRWLSAWPTKPVGRRPAAETLDSGPCWLGVGGLLPRTEADFPPSFDSWLRVRSLLCACHLLLGRLLACAGTPGLLPRCVQRRCVCWAQA